MSFTLDPRMIIAPSSVIYTDHTLRNLLWHLHGSLLCIALLILLPLGVIAVRSGSKHAVQYHWLLQASGTILALTGIALGILTSKGVSLWHQYIGIVLGSVLLFQPLSGWKHHLDFMYTKRKTYVSLVHIWSGRVVIGVSWVNIVLGLVLRNYHFLVQAGAGVAILCLIVLWGMSGLGIFSKQSAKRLSRLHERDDQEGLMSTPGNEFALESLVEEDEDENEEGFGSKS